MGRKRENLAIQGAQMDQHLELLLELGSLAASGIEWSGKSRSVCKGTWPGCFLLLLNQVKWVF